MRVYVQWTLASPTDWVELDVRPTGPNRKAWENLAAKPEPVGGEMIDNSPGWIYDLNCQGIQFGGSDHYAVEPISGGLRITTWNDDPDDYPPGARYGSVWEFLDPAPDAALGGIVNTRQTVTRYAEDGRPGAFPWSQFTPPPSGITRHGIWVSDALAQLHADRRTPHGWREWIV